MAEDKDPRHFDVRVVEHRIRHGRMTADEYRAWLDALPDESEEAMETSVRFQPAWGDRHKKQPEG